MSGIIEFETETGIAGVGLKKLVAVVIHEDNTCTFVCKPGYAITSLPMNTEALTKDLQALGIKVINDPNDVVVMED